MSDTAGRPVTSSGRPGSPVARTTTGSMPQARPGARPGQPRMAGRPDTGAGRPVRATGAMPRTSVRASAAARRGPRRVRLGVARVDPWSVMKVSFLLSVALGVASVVAVMVLWLVLNQMQVFSSLNQLVQDLTAGEGGKSKLNIMQYLGFGRVVSVTIVISVADMLIMTALSTLGAFLYNMCTSLVGGVQLTLTDE